MIIKKFFLNETNKKFLIKCYSLPAYEIIKIAYHHNENYIIFSDDIQPKIETSEEKIVKLENRLKALEDKLWMINLIMMF